MAVGTVHSYVLVGAADPAMVDLLSVRTNRTTPDFDWYFAHGYDQTIKLLPSIDHRPAPDAQHFALQVRSFVVVFVTTMPYYVARLSTGPTLSMD
jgi:hypothetical protein